MPLRPLLQRTHRFQHRRLVLIGKERSYTTDLGVLLGPRRAIVYQNHGEPSQVLYSATNNQPVRLGTGQVLIKFLMSPINPADLNTVEGTYPSKPSVTTGFDEKAGDVFIAGNEGLAEVILAGANAAANDGATTQELLKEGDWVVMNKPQLGTWTNWKVTDATNLMRIPKRHSGSNMTEVFGATMMVNALTAYGLLTEVVPVKAPHFVLQNGANSGVGQAVIQVAKKLHVKTVNFVRDRPDFEVVAEHLKSLGATHVFQYSKLLDRSFKTEFAEIRKGLSVAHALNGIGGATATAMAALLDNDGHLISYGGMSKEPLKIPVGLQIFKNLTCHGYWHSNIWNKLPSMTQGQWMNRMTSWKEDGGFQDPTHEVVTLRGDDAAVQEEVLQTLHRLKKGMVGKKLLLKWETP